MVHELVALSMFWQRVYSVMKVYEMVNSKEIR